MTDVFTTTPRNEHRFKRTQVPPSLAEVQRRRERANAERIERMAQPMFERVTITGALPESQRFDQKKPWVGRVVTVLRYMDGGRAGGRFLLVRDEHDVTTIVHESATEPTS